VQRDEFIELQSAVPVPVKCSEKVFQGHIVVVLVEDDLLWAEEAEELINADLVIPIMIY
jgi:hypothetical protein